MLKSYVGDNIALGVLKPVIANDLIRTGVLNPKANVLYIMTLLLYKQRIDFGINFLMCCEQTLDPKS